MTEDKKPTALVESPVRVEVTADATASLEKTTDTVAIFVERVVMPPAEALADLAVEVIDFCRGPFQARRQANLAKLGKRVEELREEQGVREPRALPPKSAHVVIEQASFEDDDALRDLWAQLIVNAQAGMEVTAYLFEVLSKLSGSDAQQLLAAEKEALGMKEQGLGKLIALGLLDDEYRVKVETGRNTSPAGSGTWSVPDEFKSEAELEAFGLHLTRFGQELMKAVRPQEEEHGEEGPDDGTPTSTPR